MMFMIKRSLFLLAGSLITLVICVGFAVACRYVGIPDFITGMWSTGLIIAFMGETFALREKYCVDKEGGRD
jgi:hypothetical protein